MTLTYATYTHWRIISLLVTVDYDNTYYNGVWQCLEWRTTIPTDLYDNTHNSVWQYIHNKNCDSITMKYRVSMLLILWSRDLCTFWFFFSINDCLNALDIVDLTSYVVRVLMLGASYFQLDVTSSLYFVLSIFLFPVSLSVGKNLTTSFNLYTSNIQSKTFRPKKVPITTNENFKKWIFCFVEKYYKFYSKFWGKYFLLYIEDTIQSYL